MAISCAPNDLEAAAKCFTCLEPGRRDAIIIYLLCQIAGMNCTPQSLMNAAKCYTCIPKGLRDAVMVYLLCQVATGGGGSALGSVLCGVVDPTTAPLGSCGFYSNTATGSVWYWDNPNTQWVKFIS